MFRTLPIAFLLVIVATGAVFAQAAPSGQSVSAEPEATTATYGTWTLRCAQRAQGRVCDVEQAVVPQGRQNPIAQIGFNRLSPKDEFHLTVVLPTNITFQISPRVTSSDKDPGVQLTWRRCVPGGCIADATLTSETLRAWRAIAADTGKLLFTNANMQNIAIEFSFRGFAQAIDAFVKEGS